MSCQGDGAREKCAATKETLEKGETFSLQTVVASLSGKKDDGVKLLSLHHRVNLYFFIALDVAWGGVACS
jgi:hypothetical protein